MDEKEKTEAGVPSSPANGKRRLRLKSTGQRLLGTRTSISQLTVGAFALVFMVFGSVVLLKTYAAASLELPTGANTVVMSYTLPHAAMAQSDSALSKVMYDPFTLYGNGLLVCGHTADDPFKPLRTEDDDAMMPDMPMDNVPTSATLSRQEMTTLAQQVKDAGFLRLKPEYYQNPISGRQSIVRLVSTGSEHDVLFYNDVAPPAGYTSTLQILQSACAKATATYVSDTVTVQTIAGANDPSVPTTTTQSLIQGVSATAAEAVNNALGTSDQLKAKVTTQDQQGAADSAVTDVASSSVTGQAARELQRSLKGKLKQVVTQNNQTYEMSVLPQPPTVSNVLNIDYGKIRDKKSPVAALLNKLHITSDAYAATTVPVRVVLLLPNSGGSTAKLSELQSRGDAMYKWYCAAVGKCFKYAGASVMRGSQSEAYYNGCHQSSGCGDQLLNTLNNVAAKDGGTIYRSDVDTLIVTGWATNVLSKGYCGWGYVGANLGAADYYTTTYNTNGQYFCSHGLDSAHETGHTFGLNHVCDGTLMQGCSGHGAANCDIPATSHQPTCKLNATQASTLRGEAQFFPPPPPTAATLDGVKIDDSGTGTYGGNYSGLAFSDAKITAVGGGHSFSSVAQPFYFNGTSALPSSTSGTTYTISISNGTFNGYTIKGSTWEDGTVAGWNAQTSGFRSGTSFTVTIVAGHAYHMRWIYSSTPNAITTTATLDGVKIDTSGTGTYGGNYSGLAFSGGAVTLSTAGYTDVSSQQPFFFNSGSQNAAIPASSSGTTYSITAPAAYPGYTVIGSTWEDGTVSGWNAQTSGFVPGSTRSVTFVAGHAYHMRWIYAPTATLDGVKIDTSGTGTYGGNYLNLPFTGAAVSVACGSYSDSSVGNPFWFTDNQSGRNAGLPVPGGTSGSPCSISVSPSTFAGYAIKGSTWEDGSVSGWNPQTSGFVSGPTRNVTLVAGHSYHMRWIFSPTP